MKTLIRIVKYVGLLLILLIAVGVLYLRFFLPKVDPPPELTVESSPAKIERGKYLANHVMLCMDCHSSRDWNFFSGPLVESTLGAGGEIFDENMGFPGTYISPNITPFNLKDWSDGEIFRAITTGVNKEGKVLFPIMPHPNFGQLDKEDIYAVIAYLRTLKPIEMEQPKSSSNFPVSLLINTMATQPQFTNRPASSDQIAYGKYLVTAASCVDCHSPFEKGKMVGEPYSGGMEFHMPDGSVLRSANITPHETGLKNWSVDQFVQRFKMFAEPGADQKSIEDMGYQTIMPWIMYADMTETDLRAIFAYLQSLPPVEHNVIKWSAPDDN